jgi:hypothetical protein
MNYQGNQVTTSFYNFITTQSMNVNANPLCKIFVLLLTIFSIKPFNQVPLQHTERKNVVNTEKSHNNYFLHLFVIMVDSDVICG